MWPNMLYFKESQNIMISALSWQLSSSHYFFFFFFSLTKGRSSDGFFINEEDLVRQAIKEFDYHECTIFKQLVQTIAPVEKVGYF